jgi:DtxR family manganese transport transcriptional regulator
MRHELVHNFLVALGVPAKVAAVDSEGIEHHVSPETLKAFGKYLQQLKKKR